MRIFYAAAASPNYWDLPESQALARQPVPAAARPRARAGHVRLRLRPAQQPPRPARAGPQGVHRRAPAAARARRCCASSRRPTGARPIDLFFSYFYSAYVDPDVIREIRRMGIVDGQLVLQRLVPVRPRVRDRPGVRLLPGAGEVPPRRLPARRRQPDLLPGGRQPQRSTGRTTSPAEFDVTFVGQRYGNRPTYLQRLLEAGIDVRVWGPRWDEPPTARQPVQGGRGTGAGACRAAAVRTTSWSAMYSRSRISLGFSAVAHLPKDGSPPIKQVRLRDFEAPMSGAFYLVEQFDELAEFFEPGKESRLLPTTRTTWRRRRSITCGTRPSAGASAMPACGGRGRSTRGTGGSRRRSGRWGSAHSLSPVLRGEGRGEGLGIERKEDRPSPSPSPRSTGGEGTESRRPRHVRHRSHPPRRRTRAAPVRHRADDRRADAPRPGRAGACACPAATSATRA